MEIDRGTTLTSEDHMDSLENNARLAIERAQQAEAETQRHRRLLHLLATGSWVGVMIAARGPQSFFWGLLAGMAIAWLTSDVWIANF